MLLLRKMKARASEKEGTIMGYKFKQDCKKRDMSDKLPWLVLHETEIMRSLGIN